MAWRSRMKGRRDIFAGLRDLVRIDLDIVDHEHLVAHQLVEVELQRRRVNHQLVAGLLERHQHAGFGKFPRAIDQELGGEESLAASGAAAYQGGAATRKAAQRYLIETIDAGQCFLQMRRLSRLKLSPRLGVRRARG